MSSKRIVQIKKYSMVPYSNYSQKLLTLIIWRKIGLSHAQSLKNQLIWANCLGISIWQLPKTKDPNLQEHHSSKTLLWGKTRSQMNRQTKINRFTQKKTRTRWIILIMKDTEKLAYKTLVVECYLDNLIVWLNYYLAYLFYSLNWYE